MAGDETTVAVKRAGKRVWTRPNRVTGEDEPKLPHFTHKGEKISLTVVGIIGYGRKSALGFLPKGWAGKDLVEVMERVVYPSLGWSSSPRHGNELIWDNDGRHHQKVFKEYAARAHLRLIRPWPSNSPDLNPIENVWNWIKDFVEALEPRTEQELREAVLKAWDAFPIEFTEDLINSMPKRLRLCLELKGGRIKY